MNRIALLGVVMSMCFSCGGGLGDGDAGDDAGLAFDAGADAGTDAGVTKHKYDCTLHATVTLDDGGVIDVAASIQPATCAGSQQDANDSHAGGYCTAFNSSGTAGVDGGAAAPDIPLTEPGNYWSGCSFSDCTATTTVCQ